METTEVNLTTYENPVYDKQSNGWGKERLFNKWCWGQLDSHTQPHGVGEDMGRQKLLEGMKNSTTPMEGNLEIPNEKICTFTSWGSSPTYGNLPSRYLQK